MGDNANRVNLIGIHWERAAQHANYREVVGRVPAVGTYVEKFIRFLQSNSFPLNKISLVGHSLGAQCAGFGLYPIYFNLISSTFLNQEF